MPEDQKQIETEESSGEEKVKEEGGDLGETQPIANEEADLPPETAPLPEETPQSEETPQPEATPAPEAVPEQETAPLPAETIPAPLGKIKTEPADSEIAEPLATAAPDQTPEPAPSPEPAKEPAPIIIAPEEVKEAVPFMMKFLDHLGVLRKDANLKRQQQMQEKLEAILGYVREHQQITNDEVEKLTGVKDAQAAKYLKILVNQGKLIMFGYKRNAYYKLTNR